MKKTLIFYKPEYADLAIKLRDNYCAHDHEETDIVSVEEKKLILLMFWLCASMVMFLRSFWMI